MANGASHQRKQHIREHAFELGFAGCAITSSAPIECGPMLAKWLAEGRHGQMDYLARDLERRIRPTRSMHDARSIVVVAFPYPPAPPLDPSWREKMTGRIAAYARGRDYHAHLTERLERLGETIARTMGGRFQAHVDAGPLVEKELARRAGLGWYGRNTNLLTKSLGSYFLVGCLLTDLELEPDPPFDDDHCGDCRACIPACPTGALDSGPTIDARRCISYLTIELRGPLPSSLRPLVGNWVFGCDDCQKACPWNDELPSADADFFAPYLPHLLRMSDDEFVSVYADTAVARVHRRGLARNAALALGNSLNPDALEPLAESLLRDRDFTVRGAAAWALGRLGSNGAKRVLEGLDWRREPLPVAAEVRAALTRLRRGVDTLSSPTAVGVR